MTDRKIIAMTNEEFEAVLAEAKKQLALGVELPELLRRMGDAVLASPQPRCPKCRTERIARYMLIFGRLSCPECKAEFHVQCPDDFAQFFAAAPAQEPDEAEIVRLSLEDWRYGCFVGEWSEVEAQRLLKEGQAIAEKLHDAVSKLAKLRGLKFMTFSAQEQPVDNTTKKITDKIMHLLVEALKMRRLPKEADDILLLRGSISTIVSESLAEPTER